MRYRRIALLAALVLAGGAAAKKSHDDKTQTLALPKEPPMVAEGEASRLVFQVAPLSATGLLSQQTREALKAILKANGGAPIIHIRAFVAGSGDLRRVPQIVSEVLGAKKMLLPSVSVVLAGALPLQNAQVAIEAVSVAKREVNPDGLAFVQAKSPDQLPSQALMVTCFVPSLNGASGIAARFPSAAVDIVQTQRTPARADTTCEAVARGGNVKSARVAFTGTQIAFGTDEKAAALAFQRIGNELGPSSPIETHAYALSEQIGDVARKAHTASDPLLVIPVEGVASLDGSFAIDMIAAK